MFFRGINWRDYKYVTWTIYIQIKSKKINKKISDYEGYRPGHKNGRTEDSSINEDLSPNPIYAFQLFPRNNGD